jgi:uncharacterized protein with PIN domain
VTYDREPGRRTLRALATLRTPGGEDRLSNRKQAERKLGEPGGTVKRPKPPLFLADHMLGRLARWLRAIGYDTEFDPSLDDPQLALHAAREGRVLLTRDRGLTKRGMVRRWVLIESDHLPAQLRQVLGELDLPPPEIRLSRCLACNGRAEDVPKEDAVKHVPPYVGRTQERFRRCVRCGRYYWAGTHVERMRQELHEMLQEGPPGAGGPPPRGVQQHGTSDPST